jgi:hypothetical protein
MPRVEIRVKEHLDVHWAEWLEGFSITHSEENETLLSGTLPDQAALYGLMAKIRDLGVALVAVSFGEEAPTIREQAPAAEEEAQELPPNP